MDNSEKKTYKTDSNGYMFPDANDDIQELELDMFINSVNELTEKPEELRGMPELVLEKPMTIAEKKVKKKNSTRKIWPWILLAILIILLLVAGGILFWIDARNVRLVTFNGEQQLMTDVSPEKFVDLYDNLTVSFIEDNHTVSYTYKDLGIQVKWTEDQEARFDEFAIDLDKMYFYFNYSQKLKDTIRGLNKNRQDWVSADLIETEDAFVVIPEKIGNKVDIDAVEQYVINNFGLTDLTVQLDDFKLPQPDNFITDVEFRNEVFKWESFYVTYTNGFKITSTELKPFFHLTDGYTIEFNPERKDALSEQIWKWVNEDLNSYNTLGGTHHFLTHDGQSVDLKGVNYGDKINKQKEHAFLMDVIEKSWTCENRIPEMEIDYPDDIQSNVIEVSIEQQHLWYWKNGQVLMDTDIVTGWKNKWDTPHGVYRILNKIDGVYLVGEDYKTWVDKWMRFWNGYGLHDATWRNKFGGTIYARDGSHGCINLPHAFAVKLYDYVQPGDCVVIY